MNYKKIMVGIASAALASCSAGPAGPNAEAGVARAIFGGDGRVITAFRGPVIGVPTAGGVSSEAITTTRVRLRRVGGGDIKTGLVSGQIIAVPVNVNLDIWAEIDRLQTDRARLLADWGNGFFDSVGCGSCRLEHTYNKTGRYTLTVRIVDLDAPPGTAPVTSIVVTIDVLDDARLSCADAAINFEAIGFSVPPPFIGSGVTVSSTIGSTAPVLPPSDYAPEFVGVTIYSGAPVTVLFDSDKNSFTTSIGNAAPPSSFGYQAFDANGNVVASGSASATRVVSAGASVVGTLSFATNTPFRSVVLTSPLTFGTYGYDNIVGRCQ